MPKVKKSSAPRKQSKRRVPSVEKLRKLSKAELRKIGASEKSERYVSATLKRLSKGSATYSKRQYLTKQRGGGVSLEKYAKLRAPTVRKLKSGVGKEYEQVRYRMPLTEPGFNRRVREIQRKYGVKPLSEAELEERSDEGEVYEFGSSPAAHVIFEYKNGRALTGRLTFLNEVTYQDAVADPTSENMNQAGSGKTLPLLDLKVLWLSVTLR